ncbi:MAG TPA: isochorismatase family cysteine hydrolase [Thermomonas sp.]|nr:isochorismatase family cysteine hydrolase [Thermomonas sp.]
MRQFTASDTALLIIDMMNLFDFEGGAALAKSALACSPVIRRLRDRFDDAGAPVIYVNDNFSNWQGDFHELISACQTAPAPSSTIARALAPRDGHYHVLKPKHSAFLSTPLAILLAQLGARKLVLSGIAADSCILATATDANMRELDVWVPADGVAAITRDRKAKALALIKTSLGGDIRGTRAIRTLFPDISLSPSGLLTPAL